MSHLLLPSPTSPTLVLPSNTIIPSDARGLCRTSFLSAAVKSSEGQRSAYDVLGALSLEQHPLPLPPSLTNFCISDDADAGFVVFVGPIDNDDVLLDDRSLTTHLHRLTQVATSKRPTPLSSQQARTRRGRCRMSRRYRCRRQYFCLRRRFRRFHMHGIICTPIRTRLHHERHLGRQLK